jgi:hypothetical protein
MQLECERFMEGECNIGRGKYAGGILNDVPHGRGRLTAADGSLMYEGDWLNGKYHGLGELRTKNNLLFKGQFLYGRAHGIVQVWKNTERIFTGAFVNGICHGEGDSSTLGKGTWSRGLLLREIPAENPQDPDNACPQVE